MNPGDFKSAPGQSKAEFQRINSRRRNPSISRALCHVTLGSRVRREGRPRDLARPWAGAGDCRASAVLTGTVMSGGLKDQRPAPPQRAPRNHPVTVGVPPTTASLAGLLGEGREPTAGGPKLASPWKPQAGESPAPREDSAHVGLMKLTALVLPRPLRDLPRDLPREDVAPGPSF